MLPKIITFTIYIYHMERADKYVPRTANARPWNEIEAHYLNLNEHGWGHDKLLALVRHIKSTGLSNRLFAFTSLDKLVISIYEVIEWNRESLHIEFDRDAQKWSFKYFSKPFQDAEFIRQYDTDAGIEKFDHFVSLIKW